MEEKIKKEEIGGFDAKQFLSYLLDYMDNSSINFLRNENQDPFWIIKKRGFTYAYNLPFGLYTEQKSIHELENAMQSFSQIKGSQFTFNVGPDVFGEKRDAVKIANLYGFNIAEYTCHTIDTTKSLEWIFEGFNATRKKHIKRYLKSGNLNVFRTKDPAYFKQYFNLYQSSAKRWGSKTTYAAALIEGLYKVPGIYMWVAEFNGEMLSGMICIYHKHSVFDWLAASIINDDVKKLYPAVAVQYEVIRHATENGFSSVNMGASNQLNGVSDFKDSWGAIEKKTYAFIKRKGIFAWIKKIKDRLAK